MDNLRSIEDFRAMAADDKPFCAIFSADWCPDCRVLKAVLPGLEEEYGDRYRFTVVDRDEYPSLAEEYDVLGIPSLVVLRKGQVLGTYINRLRKTRRQITDFLDSLADQSPVRPG